MKRRHFINTSALASVGTMLIPNFLKALEVQKLNRNQETDNILIIIQLSGGNDGLNTTIPYQNDLYYQARPRLAVPKNDVLKLTDEVGFNPVMQGLKSVFEEGYLSIINNVGYPNPDRSHFRSMDIWHTASDSSVYWQSGWVGRYLDSACAGLDCKTAYNAIEVDDTLSLAMKGLNIKGLAIKDVNKFFKSTQSPALKALAKMEKTADEHENVSYLYKTLAETVSSANYIQEKTKIAKSFANYPMNAFGQQLKTIAQLINSGLETNVYYASLSGFDTHVNQKNQQERLLKIYADGMKALLDDLKKSGKIKQTLIMTFSEFGRRVAQNASGGTDHGTANNLFLMGGNLKKPGIYNEMPNLTDLDEGDLKYKIDFRSIYATLLEKHLQTNSEKILNGKFDLLGIV
jgi:uncharacterized protein (DUF1501 family)